MRKYVRNILREWRPADIAAAVFMVLVAALVVLGIVMFGVAAVEESKRSCYERAMDRHIDPDICDAVDRDAEMSDDEWDRLEYEWEFRDDSE